GRCRVQMRLTLESRGTSEVAGNLGTPADSRVRSNIRIRLRRRTIAMRQKIKMAVLVAALMVAAIMPCLVGAQDLPAVSLDDRLKAHYTLVKMGWNSGGATLVEEGTVLVIKKDGIL